MIILTSNEQTFIDKNYRSMLFVGNRSCRKGAKAVLKIEKMISFRQHYIVNVDPRSAIHRAENSRNENSSKYPKIKSEFYHSARVDRRRIGGRHDILSVAFAYNSGCKSNLEGYREIRGAIS